MIVEQDFDKWFDTEFELALGSLNNKASTGLGIMALYGPTIGEVLKFDGFTYDEHRVRMFKLVVKDKISSIMDGTYKADPINTFVKKEPHKDKKCKEGRFRLIMAVSMEDTMIDRMLYQRIQQSVVEDFADNPVKSGYSPLQGGFRVLAASFPKGSLSIDKQGWDFTVKAWMINLWDQFLQDLVGQGPSWWIAIHRARFEALYGPECEYQFKDGTRAKQLYKGIMKSGCYNTLFLNSVGQLILALLACKRLGYKLGEFWTVGDDTVEEIRDDIERYIREIESMGYVVKEYSVNSFVEFCGFLSSETKVRPNYLAKHLFKALYEGGDSWIDKLEVYRMLYAYDDLAFTFFDELYKLGCGKSGIPRDLMKAMWSGMYLC